MDTFAFLLNASRTGSWSTIRAYVYGLCRLEDWTDRHGLEVLELTPRQADECIYSLRARDLAPASIRLDAAAASAFFSVPLSPRPLSVSKVGRQRGRP